MAKSDKKQTKLNHNDLINDVNNDVDLSKVQTVQFMHNSKFDKTSDNYFNRAYFVKLQVDKLSGDLVLKDNTLASKNITFRFSTMFNLSGDVLRLFDKKGTLLYSKAIVDNKLVTIDVDQHNSKVQANKVKSIKSISLSDLAKIDLSKCNDVNDIKAQLQAQKG